MESWGVKNGKKLFYEDYYLTMNHYSNNGRIALFLENEEDFWGDLTINLTDIYLEPNEVALQSIISKETIKKLEDLGLFKVVRKVSYNLGEYIIVELNEDTLKEYAIEF